MKIPVRLTYDGKIALRETKKLLQTMYGDMPFKSNSAAMEYCLQFFLDTMEKKIEEVDKT